MLGTSEILLTSEQGARLSLQDNVDFRPGKAGGVVVEVDPAVVKQELLGIGTSFTEASAFVLAHLEDASRDEVMRNIFSDQGANFTLTRTHIGACDFCVEGRYSYADRIAGDTGLQAFSIQPDLDGFNPEQYPGIKDPDFDLLPMIRQAQAIKAAQSDSRMRIIASPWTAPAWMKDIEDWYQPGTPANNFNGTGGVLKPHYEATFADYLVKYLDAYREQGVDIWGMTPVNEPLGNSGQWESMHFTEHTQNEFIKHHLGPKLHQSGYADVSLLMLDHARPHLEQWAEVIYNDPETARYVDGAAVHWYESTFKVYEDVFDRVHAKYPDYSIIHTEGCIDDLGKKAPGGVLDPEGYQESGWFDNDDFWWNENATDWAYQATWPGVVIENHPIYTPVHRYARNIIVSLDHWLNGWIDWNIVLDARGGPNHVGNYCGAPIMIDTESGHVYYTPIYYILSQLSRTIRPGDRALQTRIARDHLDIDDLHACATINPQGLLSIQLLNTTKQDIALNLQIDGQYAPITIPANALLTVRLEL